MQYYLISLIITIIIFSVIQYFEYNKKTNEYLSNEYDEYEPYSLLTINNCLLLIIIYIVSTIIAYYIYSANIDFSFILNKVTSVNTTNTVSTTTGGNDNNDIDPKILSKITDNFNVGFEPFNSDSDNESMSSLSTN